MEHVHGFLRSILYLFILCYEVFERNGTIETTAEVELALS